MFLQYASCHGQAFLDRALYLPKAWATDRARQEAGIPDSVGFATKGELARTMLARTFAAGVPARWVTADEADGNDGALRRWLQEQGRAYVLGVSRAHALVRRAIGAGAGRDSGCRVACGRMGAILGGRGEQGAARL